MRAQLHLVGKLCLIVGFLFFLQAVPAQILLDPVSHPKFVNPLPLPSVLEPTTPGGNYYEVNISEFQQDLLGLKDGNNEPILTTVWGYNGSYPGPTIEARRGSPITVKWINNLPEKHLFTIDESIHWAGTDMGGKLPGPNQTFNGVPTVTHLHGGHTNADSDGHPEAWYTPDFKYTGSNFFKNKGEFYYDNDQEAATLWYHDHVIGITRLNVYAGLAGFYLLRDDNEDGTTDGTKPGLNLPKGKYEIPIVIQDRIFDNKGQLVYPTQNFIGTNPVDGTPITLANSILPEVFGDFILVNGKTWPYVDVEPRKYRLRLLNGSDSRFYELKVPGINFNQIGSDGGLLSAPVLRNTILIGPGERIDVIVDFSAVAGQTLIMKNTARSPYPFGATVNPQTTGQIMAFKVAATATSPDTSQLPVTLAPAFTVPNTNPNPVPRQLVLFEQLDQYGRLLPSLGTAEKGALSFMDEITENPALGATEVWEIYNTTPDAHPIHLHLVHFKVINTQKFDVKNSIFGTPTNPLTNPVIRLQGSPKTPSAANAGRKDTFIVFPGEVARVQAFFDKEGEYVWHCHILSHEDHDMMRPLYVGTIPNNYAKLAATLETAMVDAGLTSNSEGLTVAPNPIQQTTQVSFSISENLDARVSIYNLMGQEVARIYSGPVIAFQQYDFTFDRQNLPAGNYICKAVTSDGRSFEKVIIAQ